MVRTKKRKETSQTSTLLDFFTASAKKPRSGTPIYSTSKHPISEDIIVISANDDEDKETLSQLTLDSTHDDPSCESPRSVFEMPSLLSKDKHPGAHEQSKDFPICTVAEVCHRETDSSLDVSVMEDYDFETLHDTCDEWAMGDGEGLEQEQQEQQEDVDDFEIDEIKAELFQGNFEDDDNTCPVCGRRLTGLFSSEVERHVNQCLDTSCVASSSQLHDVDRPIPAAQVPRAALTVSTSKLSKSRTAFSVLMSSHKENNVWEEASEAENQKGTRGRRHAPFYKVMQGMPIAVDAFRYGKIPNVTAYFLTHAHSDHYTNLSSSWNHGPIYCSQTTANLIIHMLDVNPKCVFPLPMNTPTVVPDTGGVEVTLIQANHCPGSVLFLFKGTQTVNAGDSQFTSPHVGSQRVFRYLHCGDFRASPQHVLHPEVKGQRFDTIYLDTTYLDPKYCFPPQPLVIAACAELARRIVQDGSGQTSDQTTDPDEKPTKERSILTDWVARSKRSRETVNGNKQPERVLVVVGTYTIGKERIVKAIAQAISTKVYCDPRKSAVLRCLSDPDLIEMLTNNPLEADVHIVPLHVISSDTFKDYLSKWKGHWTKAVGFRPTGWTYNAPAGTNTLTNIPHIISRDQARTFTYANLRPMRNSTPTFMLYGVPYSEHSSFFELTCFALSLDWSRMIATVNVGSAKSRGKMAKWFEKWQAERIKKLKQGGAQDIVQYRQLDHW